MLLSNPSVSTLIINLRSARKGTGLHMNYPESLETEDPEEENEETRTVDWILSKLYHFVAILAIFVYGITIIVGIMKIFF